MAYGYQPSGRGDRIVDVAMEGMQIFFQAHHPTHLVNVIPAGMLVVTIEIIGR
jgi:hypothetical protein